MLDTHAHLLMFDDTENIINEMNDDGLEAIVTIGTTIQDSAESIKLANSNENIYVAVGIYPEYAETTTKEDLETLEKFAKENKVVAIGEIGLDYHYEVYNSEAQKKLFKQQLEIADKVGLPFCIHCRQAASDVYKILSENKHLIKKGGLMHCYSEGGEWVKKFVDLGMYISFSGNVTYTKSDLSFIKEIPLDRIVVETDAPFLTPIPYRGKQNRPKYVKYVIEKLSSILNIPYKQLEKITSENAKRFYFKIGKN